jgi:putative transposase
MAQYYHIIRSEFGAHLSKFYKNNVLWSSSYYVASTGGAPIEKVKAYIKSQESPLIVIVI